MFRVAQAHMDNIWSRWLKEHLPVHNIRQKWYKERPQLQEYDLVWIVDDREKRGGPVTSLLSRELFLVLQSSCPVYLKAFGVFLLKRNTGPAMKRPENQCTKTNLKLGDSGEP